MTPNQFNRELDNWGREPSPMTRTHPYPSSRVMT